MSSSEPDATSMSCLDLWTNKVRVALLHPPALVDEKCMHLTEPVCATHLNECVNTRQQAIQCLA